MLKTAIKPATIEDTLVNQALRLALPSFKALATLLAFRRKRSACVSQEYAKLYLESRRLNTTESCALDADEQALHSPCASTPAQLTSETNHKDTIVRCSIKPTSGSSAQRGGFCEIVLGST